MQEYNKQLFHYVMNLDTFSRISINRYTIDTAKSTIHLNPPSIRKRLQAAVNIKLRILQ